MGGAIQDSTVCLRLIGGDLDPEEVTRLLGCAPTRAWRKGDVREDPRYHILQRTGVWSLDSDTDRSVPLDEQIRALIARVPTDSAVWEALARRFDIDVFCGIHLDEWNRGCGFGPDLLRRLGEMKAALDLDIYGPDETIPPGLTRFLSRPSPGGESRPPSG